MKTVKTVMMAMTAAFALALSTAAEARELKIGTLAPDGSFWMESVRRGAAEIERRTDGRVKFRFYPGGTMGNEQAMLRKIRIGQLHGTAVLSGTLATIDPNLALYSRPLTFESDEEVDAVRRQLDARLQKALEQRGFVSFGLVESGFAYVMATRSAATFADLKGRKAWLPEGDQISEALLREAGMVPVSLPLSDVMTGLQTGLVDVVAGPPVGAVALQWFTRAKYLIDLPVLYTYGGLIFGERAFSGVTAADQTVVREVLEGVVRELDRDARASNHAAREALVKQGVQIVTPGEAVVSEWREVASRTNVALRDRLALDPALVREVDAILSGHRGAGE